MYQINDNDVYFNDNNDNKDNIFKATTVAYRRQLAG